ncbi:MAG TPA: hypothetical protein VLB67_00325 [Acidimicrobiia bacterium]|nr:hypothetical protein [Acidimicrobiia bacterium]
MPEVLEEPRTLATFESVVETLERPIERAPQPPPPQEVGPVRWIAWVVGLMAVVVAGVFIYSTVGDGGTDGSFEANELARMEAMAPAVDMSFETNEFARMQALAPEVFESDGSFEANEFARMRALAPEIDDSFEANELARFLRVAPEA